MSASYDFDYIVIGSGFGGGVSACRLTEKGYSVGVMEMGRRWKAEDFPKSNGDSGRHIWRPGMRMFGFDNIRLLRHIQHYATAEPMLGVTDNKLLGEADKAARLAAAHPRRSRQADSHQRRVPHRRALSRA